MKKQNNLTKLDEQFLKEQKRIFITNLSLYRYVGGSEERKNFIKSISNIYMYSIIDYLISLTFGENMTQSMYEEYTEYRNNFFLQAIDETSNLIKYCIEMSKMNKSIKDLLNDIETELNTAIEKFDEYIK